MSLDHVLLINPWNREYLCGDPLPTHEINQRTPFEIRRSKNKSARSKGGAAHNVTVSFDEGDENIMCPRCFMLITVAKANGIDLDTLNLKSRIRRVLK